MEPECNSSVKVTFVIPQKDNDGRDLYDEIVCLETDLTNLLGGFTKTACVGGWLNDGKCVVVEGGYTYFVGVSGNPVEREEAVKKVVTCLRWFKSRTLQEKIYLDVCRCVQVRFV